MDIKEMIYFATIAEEQNLSAAAKRLGLSQPTLSAFLSTLEDEMGTDLFYREKKKLIPTEAGNIYLNAARKIIRIHDSTYVSIRSLSEEPEKVLRAAGTPLRGAEMYASIYPAFKRKYPNIRLEILESYTADIMKHVENGTVDFGMNAYLKDEHPEFTYIPASREELVLAVPSFMPVTKKFPSSVSALSTLPLTELRDAPFVMMTEGTNIRTLTDRLFQEAGFQPMIVHQSFNNSIVKRMIIEGAGAGFLPVSLAEGSDEITCYSLSPKVYMDLGFVLKKDVPVSKEIRYLAWLAALNDKKLKHHFAPEDPAYDALMEEFKDETVLMP